MWDSSCLFDMPLSLYIAVFPLYFIPKNKTKQIPFFLTLLFHSIFTSLHFHCNPSGPAHSFSFLHHLLFFCYFPLVSSTVCHVSAMKQQSQSVSLRRRGFPSFWNREAYLFIQVHSTRKIPFPSSSVALLFVAGKHCLVD